MRTSIVQFAPVFGDIEANIIKISNLIKSLENSDLIVLPELASTGYKFKDRNEALALSERAENSRYLEFLTDIAAEKSCYVVSGFNEREGEKLYNSSVLIGPDGIIGTYRKLHLFWDEKMIFESGNLGLPVFDTEIGKIGMLICFDWMFPEAWRVLALKGAELIAHPANLVLPYCQSVMPSYSLVNRLFIVTANRTGTEEDLTFTGNSVITNPIGQTIVHGSVDKEEVINSEIDLRLSVNKKITPENDVFKDRRTDVYGNFSI
jgi:predicted amidohydrolase